VSVSPVTSPSNNSTVNSVISAQTPSSSGIPTGAIVGIVVGVAALLIGVIILLFVLLLKRRHTQKSIVQNESQLQSPQSQPLQQPLVPQSQSPSGTQTPVTKQSAITITSVSASNLSLVSSFSQSTTRHTHIPFGEIVIERELGEGSSGRVFLGRWKHARVALKFCRKKKKVDNFVQEIQIFVELPPHPNVVQLYGISSDGPELILVLEYCEGGTTMLQTKLSPRLFFRHECVQKQPQERLVFLTLVTTSQQPHKPIS